MGRPRLRQSLGEKIALKHDAHHHPRRRYGADARLLFKLEDLVFGPLLKFCARELIARTPYQSWEQAAHLMADQRGNGRSRAEFGITFNAPVPGSGGVMVSERIEIEAEAVLRQQQG